MPTPAVAVGAGMPATSVPVPAVAMAQPATHHQQPQFGFQEISGLTLTALMSHVVINEQVETAPPRFGLVVMSFMTSLKLFYVEPD